MGVFDDIISNKELPDDFKIAVGDKSEMTLGELRGFHTQLAESRNRAETAAAERDHYRGEHERLSSSVAALLGTAGRMADDEGSRPPPDSKTALREALVSVLQAGEGDNPLLHDKQFSGAMQSIAEREVKRALEEIAKVNGEVTSLKDLVNSGFQGLTRAQLLEREQRWYDVNRAEIPKDKDGKRLPLTSIREYAQQHNMVVPNTQLLDYDRALESLTEPQRAAARMSEAERRGYEKGLQDARRNAGKVLPMFGDRSADALPAPAIDIKGKSARQIMEGAIAQGLAEAAAETGN